MRRGRSWLLAAVLIGAMSACTGARTRSAATRGVELEQRREGVESTVPIQAADRPARRHR